MRSHCLKKYLHLFLGLFTGSLLILSYKDSCSKATGTGLSSSINDSVVSDRPSHDTLPQQFIREQTEISYKDEEMWTLSDDVSENSSSSSDPPKSASTEWMTCDDIHGILTSVKSNETARFRVENEDGNRSIYFASVKDPDGSWLNVVIKHASYHNASSESQIYRYHSAIREIDNLQKLRSFGWRGVPVLYGACVTPHEVAYVVEKVEGSPICSGNGTDNNCAKAFEVKKFIQERQDPEYASLLWVTKVTCFFKQFEIDNIFMEDVSGANFYYNRENFDIHIVDADSLLFYGDIPLFSRSSCRSDQDCTRPTGNLWRSSALNHKIYYSCREVMGYCLSNRCRGYDAFLHTCGVGRWLISPMRNVIPIKLYDAFRKIMHCTMEEIPGRRCSMATACDNSEQLLKEYEKWKGR